MDTTRVAGGLSRSCQCIVTSWAQYRGHRTPAEYGTALQEAQEKRMETLGQQVWPEARAGYPHATSEASESRSVGVWSRRCASPQRCPHICFCLCGKFDGFC